MKRTFKDCPKCGEKDGIKTIVDETDRYIEITVFKCDTCPHQPEFTLKDTNQ